MELEAALNLKLNEWMEREELKWKKKFIELWLKIGGQNSKKIHLSNLFVEGVTLFWRLNSILKNEFILRKILKGTLLHNSKSCFNPLTHKFLLS